MGLIVSILKDGMGDYSNGGVSGRANQLTLINVDGPFEPSVHAPAAMLVKGNLGGAKVIPCVDDPTNMFGDMSNQIGPMMGGTFVTTSDSRFSNKLEKMGVSSGVAIPFHDRYETTEQHRALSL
tara:strand:+ start:1860 stop:2231 length:372 start_codon:yes stop_codon:yes gene_type:complete